MNQLSIKALIIFLPIAMMTVPVVSLATPQGTDMPLLLASAKQVASKAGAQERRLNKAFKNLDKYVAKVEFSFKKGQNPASRIKKFEGALNINRENYPAADFSAYVKKLADFKQRAAAPKTSVSPSSGSAVSSSLTGKQRKKFNSAIAKIEKAALKVEDSIAQGKKADNRLRYMEKKIAAAKKKFPGQDFSHYEKKLAGYQSGNELATQEKDFEVFDNNFEISLASGLPSAPRSARSKIESMRIKYPKVDFGPYEDQIVALEKANETTRKDSVLGELVAEIEYLEKYFSDDKDYYVSEIETRFKKIHKRMNDFKKDHADIDISAFGPRIAKLRKQVDAKQKRIAGEIRLPKPDQGITSGVHEKNKGRVVFSNKPILLGSESESNFITTYTLGDALYFRVYLSDSEQNMYAAKTRSEEAGKKFELRGGSNIVMLLKTTDKQYGSSQVKMLGGNYQQSKHTSWGGQLFNPDDMSQKTTRYDDNVVLEFNRNIYQLFLRQVLGGMPAKDTVMKLKVVLNLTEPQDSSEKRLVLSAGDLNLSISEARLKKVTTMKGMCLDAAGLSNKGLQSAALESIRLVKDKFEFSEKAVIRDKGWTMVRHPLSGALTERRIVAQFMVKNKKARCYSYQTVMAQQYLDNDKWSDFYVKEGRYNGLVFNPSLNQASCRCLND